MNIFKKWWLYYLVVGAPSIYLLTTLSVPETGGDLPTDGFTLLILIFIWAPIFFIVSLILNIVNHSRNKTKVTGDWKFWLWIILLALIVISPIILTAIQVASLF